MILNKNTITLNRVEKLSTNTMHCTDYGILVKRGTLFLGF